MFNLSLFKNKDAMKGKMLRLNVSFELFISYMFLLRNLTNENDQHGELRSCRRSSARIPSNKLRMYYLRKMVILLLPFPKLKKKNEKKREQIFSK